MPKPQLLLHQNERNRPAEGGPIRTCAGCGRAQSCRALGRVASQNGEAPFFDAQISLQRRANGRGAWICRSERCVELAWKKRGFERVLKLKNRAPDSLKTALLQWCSEACDERGTS